MPLGFGQKILSFATTGPGKGGGFAAVLIFVYMMKVLLRLAIITQAASPGPPPAGAYSAPLAGARGCGHCGTRPGALPPHRTQGAGSGLGAAWACGPVQRDCHWPRSMVDSSPRTQASAPPFFLKVLVRVGYPLRRMIACQPLTLPSLPVLGLIVAIGHSHSIAAPSGCITA